ncbi:hypothetical protein [Cupriavidus alkaliphilus]|uniref:hypothetical protein n=1 Tax=Cupriavidus alkaliphilus TaxID=942866 RepID=UPI000E307D06|nr:hypothetical protein [Cupriavidus alkaliphilus]
MPEPLAAPLLPLEVPLGLVVLVAPEVPVDVLAPGVLRLRFCSVTEPDPDSEPEPLVLPVAVQPARMPSASKAVPMRKGVFMLSSIRQVGGKPCCMAHACRRGADGAAALEKTQLTYQIGWDGRGAAAKRARRRTGPSPQ